MINLQYTSSLNLDKIIMMENDFETNKFIIPYSKERHQHVIDKKDEQHLSVFDMNNNLIGFVIIAGLYDTNDSIEFRRVVIRKKNKGKGYGNEVIERIKKKCFEEFKCHRLWLDVFDFNQRAIHIYKKAGFNVEGVLRECYKTKKGYQNLVIMSILRNEYEKNHNMHR